MSDDQWTFSQQFSTRFASESTNLSTRINDAKAAGTVSNETLAEFSTELSKLSKELADAIGSLPTYDQKGHENQLKSIGSLLESLRKASQPVSKFAFKRKPAAPRATPVVCEEASAPTSSTVASPSSSYLVAIASLANQVVAIDSAPTTAKDLTISDLTNCVVNLLDHTSISAVHVRNVRNTVILLPLIQSTIMMHDMENCIITVGCHQFRMHTSHDVDVYLAISSNPIIEHCSKIRFSGYPATLYNASQVPESKHMAVQDFSHIKATPSPNWSALPRDDEIQEWPLTKPLDAFLANVYQDDDKDDGPC
ncbi:tubulin binding cofactor C-domain-containing protein [Mucidula mucida]|nr:tubulin binding cofactor C-domain-containing protein [Mucidula mucida]